MTVEDSVVLVEPGSVIYVPPGGKQSLENSWARRYRVSLPGRSRVEAGG